jgi:hypothetical protein
MSLYRGGPLAGSNIEKQLFDRIIRTDKHQDVLWTYDR